MYPYYMYVKVLLKQQKPKMFGQQIQYGSVNTCLTYPKFIGVLNAVGRDMANSCDWAM